jgi:hypothetical protein
MEACVVERINSEGEFVEWGTSARTDAYLRKIRRDLERAGLSHEIKRLLNEIGWAKLKEFSHLLEYQPLAEWEELAKSSTQEQLRQAAKKEKAQPPRKPRVTLMFRIPQDLRDEFWKALEERGWEYDETKRGHMRPDVEPFLRELLGDAKKRGKAR